MNNAFSILNIPMTSSSDEIHNAYIKKVKECHYDNFNDLESREAAESKMIELNIAYKEAIKFAERYEQNDFKSIDHRLWAKKLYDDQKYEGALFQLERDPHHDKEWYFLRGKILLALNKYEDSHSSFREAVKLDPENKEYRQGALDAALAYNKSNFTISGKLKKYAKKYFNIG